MQGGAELHQRIQTSLFHLITHIAITLPLAMPAHRAMTLFRPSITSHAYFNLPSLPLTRRLPALIPPRLPLRTFHHPACFRVPANKPARTAPSSNTLLPSGVIPASRHDGKGLASGDQHNLHAEIAALSSSHAVHPSIGTSAQIQSHLSSSPPSNNGLASNVYSKPSQRHTGWSGWRKTLHSPQRSGDTMVIRSSLLRDLRQEIGVSGLMLVTIVAGLVVLGTVEFIWAKITGQPVQTELELCRRCGRKMISEGWYWRDELPAETPLEECNIVCWSCSKILRKEGHYLLYVGDVRK